MIRHWSLQRLFLDLDCLDFVDFSRRGSLLHPGGSYTAQLRGTVMDQSKGQVAKATVTITNVATSMVSCLKIPGRSIF